MLTIAVRKKKKMERLLDSMQAGQTHQPRNRKKTYKSDKSLGIKCWYRNGRF